MSQHAGCRCGQPAASLSVAVAAALNPAGEQLSAATPSVALSKRPRRRLWELAVKHHCVLLGAAFDAGELRRMFRRGGYADWQSAGDYELHSSAVCFARERNDFSALAQKRLDERFRPAVHRISAAATGDDIVRLWQCLVDEGDPVGAYWAALTHCACDPELDEAFSRQMHMIAHEEFAARRATLRRVNALEARNRDLISSLHASREASDALRKENVELRAAAQAERIETARLRADLERWRSGDETQALRDKQARLEGQLEAVREEADAARRALRAAERRTERAQIGSLRAKVSEPLPSMPEPSAPQLPDLSGQRVLCVGGKASLVAHYRALVEQARGEFLHHDGGDENNVARLPAMLAAAELIVCLASHCSHAAYRIAKRYCKAKGKPCALAGGSSAAAVARALGVLGSGNEERQWNHNHASPLLRCISSPGTAMSASSRSCPA